MFLFYFFFFKQNKEKTTTKKPKQNKVFKYIQRNKTGFNIGMEN